MTHRHELTIRLTLRSPFLMPGPTTASLGLDSGPLLDEFGRALVPADQVKGLLRAACRTLAQATDGGIIKDGEIDALFGCRSPEVGALQNEPARGRLIVADLVGPRPDLDKNGQPLTLTRVAIDERTGAAKQGALVVVGLVAPVGKTVSFESTAILRCSPDEAKRWATALDKALRLIPAVGSSKTAGFGEVVAEETEVRLTGTATALTLPAAPARNGADRAHLRLTLDRRFVVDSTRLNDNVFVGSEIIPGAVIKGALARRLELAGTDPTASADLSRIRISHAFPENGVGPGARPANFALPFSLIIDPVSKDTKGVRDALLTLHGKAATFGGRPPAYILDWKGAWFEDVRKIVGYPPEATVTRLPRTHVEIDETHTAKDGALFVDVGRSPLMNTAKEGEAEKLEPRPWRLTLDRNGADPTFFARVVAALTDDGLDGIGSTGARATFTPVADDGRPGALKPVRDDLWAVTLITPALMLAPRPLREDVRAGNPDALFQHYAAYWRAAAEGAELRTFFATQSLAGRYLAVRRRSYRDGTYYPYLLTNPGSVFLLKGDLKSVLQRLSRSGLPAQSVEGEAGTWASDWRTCPYVPENGFGDFIVNAVDHAALRAEVTDV
ncbi:MAG: hypothetical protein RLY86_2370 [Pseudomonadota bacterium]|jgi:hypothetical protein